MRPVLEQLGSTIFIVGDRPGQGQIAKVINNLMSASSIAITAEAMALGVKAGLDAKTLLEVVGASSGSNNAALDKFPNQVLTRRFDHGFRLALMAKDVRLCLAEAQRRGVPMLLGSTVDQLWSMAAQQAADTDDCTAIVRMFEDWAGATIAGGERAMTDPSAAALSSPARDAATTYGVLAVRYAERETTLSEVYYRWPSYGEPDGPLDMTYYFWILEPPEGPRIVVDSGFAPEVGARMGRPCSCEPADALARLGIDGADVQQVVVTHLHYDHIGNLDLFPNAELVVAQRELDFWTDPIAARPHFAEHTDADAVAGLERAAADGRVRAVDEELEVAPGIVALRVGGHSPGQLVLSVCTAGGGAAGLGCGALLRRAGDGAPVRGARRPRRRLPRLRHRSRACRRRASDRPRP